MRSTLVPQSTPPTGVKTRKTNTASGTRIRYNCKQHPLQLEKENEEKKKVPRVPRAYTRTLHKSKHEENSWEKDKELKEVQASLASYKYNMNGPSYNVCKDRPLTEMMDTAGEILGQPDKPIQCVEAAFLGLRLTQGMIDVVRFPISFHSKKWKDGHGPFPDSGQGTLAGSGCKAVGGRKRNKEREQEKELSSDGSTSDDTSTPKEKGYEIINHLVIGLFTKGRYGAMGISRHQGLHSKAMTFHSLPDLIWDYSQNYKNDRQQLLSVRLGEAISHQGPDSYMPTWRKVEVKLSRWHIAEQRLYQFQEQLLVSHKKVPVPPQKPLDVAIVENV
eukprot:TRINITY_DN5376_c0_g1_i2.p1 TRINITY_DN5376_c0_g1~~TRINITY_DN5376_c0_g1_i2.p1  ORF type:complete len:332 (+),score=31.19 TRINITY_DN5376_c0_g1_i2:77-1072(+)